MLITKILNEKKSRNGSYSLRALARDLRLDVAQVQRILTHQKKPGPVVAFRVAQYLNLDKQEFIRLIESTLKE